jgi:two-component system, sensor histidine kinase SagS
MNLSERKNNHRILVVDDEVDVQAFLRTYLEALGWEITTVSSVADAMNELEQGSYFLVLTDIAMPDMDGYEFMCAINEKHINSQVVLMTGFGYNPNHTLVKISKTLRYPCLFKPFDRTKVADTVLKAWNEYNKGPAHTESSQPNLQDRRDTP